ncbi:MAG: helix-turn-helix transcriptional regulator [Oscillospiraceae bacterium]|nr:helix-turn-helix transcriptional regulator [Oscillospiraceae bacterium]
MENFSSRLRKLRNEKKITQKAIADQFEQSVRAYQYYESGERYPEFLHLIALADYFDVSLDYLVGRSDIRERR